MATPTPTWISRPWVVSFAAAAPLLVCGVLSRFRDEVTAATAVLVLVLVVVVAAATGERLAGLVAALSSTLWFDFFLTQPYNTFTIRDADDIEVAVLLLLISGAVVEVALWGRREQQRASLREGYLDGVLRAAQAISSQEQDRDVLGELVARQITEVLDVGSCQFVPGPVPDQRYAVMQPDGTVVRNGHEVDVRRSGLPTNEQTALPVRRGTRTLGYFLVTSASDVARPSVEQRRVAVLLADQMAAALARD